MLEAYTHAYYLESSNDLKPWLWILHSITQSVILCDIYVLMQVEQHDTWFLAT